MSVDVRADRVRPGASLLKLPLVGAVLDSVESGRLDGSSRVRVGDLPHTALRSVLAAFDADHELALRELCALCLVTSDNAIAQRLVQLVGADAVNRQAASLGCARTRLAVGFDDSHLGDAGRANVTTAREARTLVTALVRERGEIARALENNLRGTRIPLRLPDATRAPHKTGTLPGVVCDAGLVFGERSDLAVAFLCEHQADGPRTGVEIGDCVGEVRRALGEATVGMSRRPGSVAAGRVRGGRFLAVGIRVDLYLRELRDFPGDAALGWREEGIRGVGAELRRVTLGQVRWSNRYLILERRLDDLSEAGLPAGVRIDAFGGPDWSALAPIAPARALRAFRARSERGGRTCIAAWRDGRPVGYTWVSESVEPEIEALPLGLPDDAVYGWHLHVAPRERGAGIGTALVRARLLHARKRGFRREWRAIRADNRPAVRTAVKIGGELMVVGRASLTKRLGRDLRRVRALPPAPRGARVRSRLVARCR